VIIYSKVLELGVYQISCSFSQDLEVVLIIISNSITYCALKTYIQILKVVAAHWAIPSNIAPPPTHTDTHTLLRGLFIIPYLFLPLWISLKHLMDIIIP
jgi:hypothetical protein